MPRSHSKAQKVAQSSKVADSTLGAGTALNTDVLRIIMHRYLPEKDALNLALCNRDLVRDVHCFSSVVLCAKKADFVSKVFSKLVARPVVTHYQQHDEEPIYEPKQEGDSFYSWTYEVTVHAKGLYLSGNLQESTTQQAVVVNVIPNVKAKRCQYGWYEVYSAASSVCMFRGTYTNGLKALLSPFRVHVDAMEDAVNAARDSSHFYSMKRAMDNERERNDQHHMDWLEDFDLFDPLLTSSSTLDADLVYAPSLALWGAGAPGQPAGSDDDNDVIYVRTESVAPVAIIVLDDDAN
jgi:hypothetical protein